MFWVTGKITAIDAKAGSVTVQMPKPDLEKGEWRGFKYWAEAMEKYGTKLPERGTTTEIYRYGKPMLEGDDSARTFNLNIDNAVEISVNGIIQYDMSGIKIGDQTSFSFNMFMKNKHPNYYPWHMLVVTKDKLTEIKMNGEVLAK
ncbi:MAG: hypothetical protein DRH57_08735 [Candidatus Cloacimonadota bacterium]|nr:MAG: hypothetical protein DRH57_08735 [Candidatus Cloacimonadota bacterium]